VSIVSIGDPEDGRLIASQLHLMRLESLSGDVDLDQMSYSRNWVMVLWERRRIEVGGKPA
jgi:hypothetical protein